MVTDEFENRSIKRRVEFGGRLRCMIEFGKREIVPRQGSKLLTSLFIVCEASLRDLVESAQLSIHVVYSVFRVVTTNTHDGRAKRLQEGDGRGMNWRPEPAALFIPRGHLVVC